MASGGTYARLFNPIILFALLCAVLAGVGMHLAAGAADRPCGWSGARAP